MSWQRALDRAGDLALSVGALVGALCLVLTLGGLLFGVRPVIFQSGSMSPAIPAGGLALAKEAPAKDLRVGDIVTVRVGDTRVSHRIVDVAHHEPTATLQLRGDANNAPDEQTYEVVSAPRVLVSVPVAGSVLAWLSRSPGIFVVAGYAAIFLALVLRRATAPGGPRHSRDGRLDDGGDGDGDGDGDGAVRRDDDVSRKHRPRRARRVVLAMALSAAAVATSAPAWASFTDSVPVSGSTVATGTVPAPSSFTCGLLGVLSVTFNWTAVPGATSYTVHYGAGGAQTTNVTGTSTTIVTAIAGGTAWVQANHNYGSTTWTSVASQTRTYTVAVASLCA
jgi:signal peptidase I